MKIIKKFKLKNTVVASFIINNDNFIQYKYMNENYRHEGKTYIIKKDYALKKKIEVYSIKYPCFYNDSEVFRIALPGESITRDKDRVNIDDYRVFDFLNSNNVFQLQRE